MEKISEVEVTIAGRRYPLRRVQLICEDPTKTKTSPELTRNTDVKTIIARAIKTGQPLGTPGRQPIYGDFTNLNSESFLDSLNQVANVKSQFEHLPSEIRARFLNDPAKLLDFLADEKNNEESIKLGLRKQPLAPKDIQPPAAESTPPASTTPAATPPK